MGEYQKIISQNHIPPPTHNFVSSFFPLKQKISLWKIFTNEFS